MKALLRKRWLACAYGNNVFTNDQGTIELDEVSGIVLHLLTFKPISSFIQDYPSILASIAASFSQRHQTCRPNLPCNIKDWGKAPSKSPKSS
jgi:hypothetical protein